MEVRGVRWLCRGAECGCLWTPTIDQVARWKCAEEPITSPGGGDCKLSDHWFVDGKGYWTVGVAQAALRALGINLVRWQNLFGARRPMTDVVYADGAYIIELSYGVTNAHGGLITHFLATNSAHAVIKDSEHPANVEPRTPDGLRKVSSVGSADACVSACLRAAHPLAVCVGEADSEH
jgi:hypothetical protein